MTSTATPPGLARFNALEEHAAHTALLEVCASTAWARRLLAARPYADSDALYAESDAAVAGLIEADLAEAMAGHPPIGRPERGTPLRRGSSAAWPGPTTTCAPRCWS